MDLHLAKLDNAINNASRAEYIASLDAESMDAQMARLDNATDERALAEHIARLAARRTSPEYFSQVDMENERRYRSLAADSQDSANVALFTARADFYGQRAASR